MKTVQVGITPRDGLKIMRELDNGLLPWHLLSASFDDGHLVFEIYQDGSDTGHEVKLCFSGEWEFSTHIRVDV